MCGVFCAACALGETKNGVVANGAVSNGAAPHVLVEPPIVATNAIALSSEKARADATLLYVNHLNYVIAKLGNMNDVFVLQQEYENLTDDNLNLEVIPDEVTMQTVVLLMDAVKDLMKAKVEAVQAQLTFEQKKRDAIWKALPAPGVIAVANPVTLAVAVSGAALTSVQNYYNAKAEAQNEETAKKFEIGSDRLDHINEINKELFESQWRLMHKYGIRDRARVTRSEVSLFLGFAEVLKGEKHAKDANRNRLVFEIFQNHESEMRNLPFYWMTRAVAANLAGEKRDVLKSCREFFELYKTAPIVRRDMDACAMALLYVSTAMDLEPTLVKMEKERVCHWLDFVLQTVRIPEWQTKFAVAMIYRKIGEEGHARTILKKTLLEVYACVKVWEESNVGKGKGKNIFRKTPALEKAYADMDDKEKKQLNLGPTNVVALVPYDGYVWLAGALYSMGEKTVFEDYSCNQERCGTAVAVIKGQYVTRSPVLEFKGRELTIHPNGLWEDDESKVVVKIDGRGWDFDKQQKRFSLPQMPYETLEVCVQTKMGINLNFKYAAGKYDKPSETPKASFPWRNSQSLTTMVRD